MVVTPRARSRAAALAGAIAGAIIGPVAVLAAVMLIGRLLPFDEATGSAAFALLFYLIPAACIVGALAGWARFGSAPADRPDAPVAPGKLPPSGGRMVAARLAGAVAGMIAIDVIAAVWKAASGGVGDGRVYLVLVLGGTPAAIILGAIAGGRAVERRTGAAPE